MSDRRWTEAETARALEMREAEAPYDEIAQSLGRTLRSVKSRIFWIKMSPKRRERVRQRVRTYREGRAMSCSRPSDDVLIQLHRLADIEPTPNMIVLGDPPPGRSALDRLRAAKETHHVAG